MLNTLDYLNDNLSPTADTAWIAWNVDQLTANPPRLQALLAASKDCTFRISDEHAWTCESEGLTFYEILEVAVLVTEAKD